VTGPTLPPARTRRGQLLLTGRLHPRDAHPLELAYAARHILTHAATDADAWRRPRGDAALAELRASLGDHPRILLGEAALRAVTAKLPATECRRCRALMLACVYKLRPPGFDAATVYLIGNGCDKCRPKTQPTGTRAGGASRLTSTGASSTPPARPSLVALKSWLQRAAQDDVLLSNAVRKLLGDQPLPGSLGLPPVSNHPVLREFR
jgi:hypothetical protein